MRIKHTAEKRSFKDGRTGQTHEVWVVTVIDPTTKVKMIFRYAYDTEPTEVVKNLSKEVYEDQTEFSTSLPGNYKHDSNRYFLLRPITGKNYWHIING